MTEQSPLERAARDLCEASFDGHGPDDIYSKATSNPCPNVPLQEGEFDDVIDGEHFLNLKYWRIYVPQARAVLMAIREPSDAMNNAGSRWAENASLTWQSMIDAALGEGQ